MRFTDTSSSDGVAERPFTLGEIPGVLWTPEHAAPGRPLVLLGHGGGQHKTTPGMVARARRLVGELGYAAVAVDAPGHGDRPTDPRYDALASANRARIDAGEHPGPLVAAFQALVARQTVPEWRAVLDAVQDVDGVGPGPVGYFGVSLGCGLGLPFVAAEPRVRAAVLGLGGAPQLVPVAARVTVPVEFLVQWDDERVPRDESLAVFDALASEHKTLHANPGPHADLPRFEVDSMVRFFARHLG